MTESDISLFFPHVRCPYLEETILPKVTPYWDVQIVIR